jgi:hypothetical protein
LFTPSTCDQTTPRTKPNTRRRTTHKPHLHHRCAAARQSNNLGFLFLAMHRQGRMKLQAPTSDQPWVDPRNVELANAIDWSQFSSQTFKLW